MQKKLFDKIQQFMIKILQKVGLNIIKAIHDKPTAVITRNGEKSKAFLLRSGIRQGCSLSSFLVNIALEVLSRVVRRKRNKRNQIGKEEVKLSLFAADMIPYTENPKDATRKVLELINESLHSFTV